MKTTVEIICDSEEVATRVESYAKKVHGGAEIPFVRAVGVEGRICRVVYDEIGLDEEDPTRAFEERLTGYRDGLQDKSGEGDSKE